MGAVLVDLNVLTVGYFTFLVLKTEFNEENLSFWPILCPIDLQTLELSYFSHSNTIRFGSPLFSLRLFQLWLLNTFQNDQ